MDYKDSGEVDIIDSQYNIIDYFTLYGPFAVLFVSLFFWTLKTYNTREELYRSEIANIRKEYDIQSQRHHEILTKFAEKYDIVIDKLNALEIKIDTSKYDE
ncbi:BhlA/UviB family holin-like peptide [Longirhabdus pacifica]|uniref:BhlA/UviB family holin-like peptide n=1 Tax=Longirhabdus pacifica TaxID=2305227 RepID=UPI001F0BC28C|nr:BhlA/UviB family holin-like peptide [Longirhabdus pacifica]